MNMLFKFQLTIDSFALISLSPVAVLFVQLFLLYPFHIILFRFNSYPGMFTIIIPNSYLQCQLVLIQF